MKITNSLQKFVCTAQTLETRLPSQTLDSANFCLVSSKFILKRYWIKPKKKQTNSQWTPIEMNWFKVILSAFNLIRDKLQHQMGMHTFFSHHNVVWCFEMKRWKSTLLIETHCMCAALTLLQRWFSRSVHKTPNQTPMGEC